MSQTPNTAIAVIGIDIGKNSFHVVGHDARGAIVLRQKWSRGQVEARLANIPPCLIGMEACVGAHHLSRKLASLGHDARLMPAKYVRPYSKGQKNDFNDAEAIAELDGVVSVANVASYRHARRVAVDIPGHGVVHGDVAWWFEDPARLDELDSRIDAVTQMARKHRVTPEELRTIGGDEPAGKAALVAPADEAVERGGGFDGDKRTLLSDPGEERRVLSARGCVPHVHRHLDTVLAQVGSLLALSPLVPKSEMRRTAISSRKAVSHAVTSPS